jgi:hypothetical protein
MTYLPVVPMFGVGGAAPVGEVLFGEVLFEKGELLENGELVEEAPLPVWAALPVCAGAVLPPLRAESFVMS